MNKLTILLIAALSSLFVCSCDDEVDAPKVLEIYSGYYVYGDATQFTGVDNYGIMVNGSVVGQATKYLTLSSGSIIVSQENNSTADMPNSTVFGVNSADEFILGGDPISFSDVAGNYFFRSDTTANTVVFVAVDSWGIIGSGTPGGWGEDTNMTLESSDNGVFVYTVTADLVGREWLKFRANDQWAPQFGVTDGSLALRLVESDSDPGSIQIPESGNYTVKLILGAGFKYELNKN